MDYMEWYEVIGWFGVAILIVAFGLNSFEIVKPRRLYQLLNIVGAAGVGLSAFMKDAFPATAIEVAWIVIAILAIIRLHFKKP